MRSSIAALAALVALSGCKSEKLKSVEAELAAGKARLATLEAKRQELTARARQLQLARKTFAEQADQAELARNRLWAAAGVLQGQPVPDGVLLDDALRAKSPELGALAAQIVQRQLPCEAAKAEGDERDGPDCEPPPLDDACDGVAERVYQEFQWGCSHVVAAGNGPATAVCTSRFPSAGSEYPLFTLDDRVEAVAVRLAFENKGRLFVADWPPPSLDLYRPANESELTACGNENAARQCVRNCDSSFNRLPGGCDDWAGDGDEADYGEESEEPAELRQAREAAAIAEREAAEAREELAYQECLAPCQESETGETPEPRLVGLGFKRTPAPGVFQFEALVPQPDGGTSTRALLLSFPAYFQAIDGTLEVPEKDTVLELSEEFETERLIEGPVVDGKQLLAGVSPEGQPVAIEVTLDGSASPVWPDLDEVRAFAEKGKHAGLVAAVDKAKAERAAYAAKLAAKDAGVVDAGVVDAGVTNVPADAGGVP